MGASVWQRCLERLESELSADQFNTWLRPLQAREEGDHIHLLAPNQYVLNWVKDHHLSQIESVLRSFPGQERTALKLRVGSGNTGPRKVVQIQDGRPMAGSRAVPPPSRLANNVNRNYSFDSFVVGKSNQLARAASLQVADNPGVAYNPLFIYGGVGLGKTHLMQAIGNELLARNPSARVLYLHSERFVADMVTALQRNAIDDFKRLYRSLNALLIDDIQFFAGKERSQEELFHTFNSLVESQQQIIMTCDRYPKEVDGLEERLKSRFGWGLTVAIEAPELETRVAILKSKAEQAKARLPSEVAFFIARRIRSNVRELEGALRRVIADANITGQPITVEFAQQALRDLIAVQDKLLTIENIQKTVAEYYKIRIADLLSKRRNRSIARPRQLAMTLAKELTNHSLPEIGEAFNGRDHTTVLHACRKIVELRETDARTREDFENLLRILNAH